MILDIYDDRLLFEAPEVFADYHDSCDDVFPELASLGIIELIHLGDDRDADLMDLPRQHSACMGAALNYIIELNWRDDLQRLDDETFARPTPSF